jgi:hypothetical protein
MNVKAILQSALVVVLVMAVVNRVEPIRKIVAGA